ncbi:alpha-1A adrenergic receptor-like [Pollicipes pollicipes]|uniref:alpha-1A adrenergic receptor-like n=1 Tax=Pollicipes pollicipes TaxID=41117 RepID=UPI001885601E|nr:alpha-1A adrenergic receptor-like [Pollicipes pollicipes]
MLNGTEHQYGPFLSESMMYNGQQSLKSDNPYSHKIYWNLNKIIIMIITMITLTLGVAGNIMILLTVVIRRVMHNPISYYMVNLAVVHTVLALVVCPFLTFQILRDVHYRREECTAFYVLLYWLALLLVLFLLTIGVDRLWKERWNWHYLTHHSGGLALGVVLLCWLTAGALATGLELTGSARHPLREKLCYPSGPAARVAPPSRSAAPPHR